MRVSGASRGAARTTTVGPLPLARSPWHRASSGSAAAKRSGTRRRLTVEALEPRRLLAAEPIISEFMARNRGGLQDGDGRGSDWIEIFNAGDQTVDLAGYHLTDTPENKSKWTFPSVQLDPGRYLVVFASGREGPDLTDAAGHLHTNFKLSGAGEYVALVAPDGTVRSQYGSDGSSYGQQATNVSYGVAQSVTLVDVQTDVSYLVPTDDGLATNWTTVDFDAAAHGFSSGKASLGMESRPGHQGDFSGQFETGLPDPVHAVYTRVPFTLRNASAVRTLRLRLKYDNGFVAYLNGLKVASDNAPDNPGGFSTALEKSRSDADALQFAEFDLSGHLDALVDGTNVLALHGMNHFGDADDMLLVPELHATFSDMLAGVGIDARVGYMPTPTPGQPNVDNQQVFQGVVAETQVTAEHGFYDAPQQVTISTQTDGAKVYYTTDGSRPDPTNPAAVAYSEPVSIATTTVLRAAAFKPDYVPSRVGTHTYVFIADVINQGNQPDGYPSQWKDGNQWLPADYEMDPEITTKAAYQDVIDDALLAIPTVSLVTDVDNLFDPDTGIYMNPEMHGVQWERPASVEWILPDGGEGFQADAGLRIQGGFGRKPRWSPKHSFRLLLRSDYGEPKLRYPLFGDEATDQFDTFILRAGFGQAWIHENTFIGDSRRRAQYIRDQWAKDTQLAMGHVSAHNRYAHLYVNGIYWGMYNLSERPNAPFAAAYFGGDKEDYDVINSSVPIAGDLTAWDQMFQMANAGLKDDQAYRAFTERLDIDAFIDYMILNQYGGNMDWDNHNWYVIRKREPGGKFYFVTWDSENLFIDLQDNRTRENVDQRPGRLLHKLMENEEFRIRFADHVQRHFFDDGLLTPERVTERWEARSAQIYDALVAESARWGDYRRDVHPWSKGPYELMQRDDQWMAERRRLLTEYFPLRTDVVLGQYRQIGFFPETDAPRFSQHGGAVRSGFELTLSNPNESGTVYFTVDGSDPRAAGGGVAAGAWIADAADPLTIRDTTVVRARVLRGTEWSALREAEFRIRTADSPLNLRITEVNYNPHPANVAPGWEEPAVENDEFEFVEVANTSSKAVDASGVRITGGIEFTFPASTIFAPGQRAVVVKNRSAFQSRYGTGPSIVGEFAGGELWDLGEVLQLRSDTAGLIQSFSYGLGRAFPDLANGKGASLEVNDPLGYPRQRQQFRASSQFGGSPGAVGSSSSSPVLVSELLTHSTVPDGDMVELRNRSAAPVSVGNWYLGDLEDPFRYRIPSSTTVPAGGYLVLDQRQLGFGFDGGQGGDLLLIEADASGRPLRFVQHVQFGPAGPGISFGPWPDQDGPLWPLAEPTFGSTNTGPWIGEVMITELHYHAIDVDGPGPARIRNLEFVELYNRTDRPIDLSDWKLSGAVAFTFDTGTVIPAQQTLIVVPFDPEKGTSGLVFRFLFGVDPSTPLVGRYKGKLPDDAGQLRLERPARPTMEDPSPAPYLTVDQLAYDHRAPWPAGAGGQGDSLTRISRTMPGSLPASWTARPPSPSVVDFFERLAGDANEDGQFDAQDIVLALQAGKFLTGELAGWSEGDWTGDGRFDQFDIIAALQGR